MSSKNLTHLSKKSKSGRKKVKKLQKIKKSRALFFQYEMSLVLCWFDYLQMIDTNVKIRLLFGVKQSKFHVHQIPWAVFFIVIFICRWWTWWRRGWNKLHPKPIHQEDNHDHILGCIENHGRTGYIELHCEHNTSQEIR